MRRATAAAASPAVRPGRRGRRRVRLCGRTRVPARTHRAATGKWRVYPCCSTGAISATRTTLSAQRCSTKLVERGRLPGVLGNCHASGTEIIARLGEEHVRTGKPIVYTSADSVFQIAAHEESFGLERLLELCWVARELVDEYRIGRVIARPFVGTARRRLRAHRQSARLCRTAAAPDGARQAGRERRRGDRDRQDPATSSPTAASAGGQGRRATRHCSTRRSRRSRPAPDRSIVFSNFVDFDMLYGHRRDIEGYATALEYFDTRLPALLAQLRPGDLAILSADHGCDPTWPGSDHTREHVPVLVSDPACRRARSADARRSRTSARRWRRTSVCPRWTTARAFSTDR